MIKKYFSILWITILLINCNSNETKLPDDLEYKVYEEPSHSTGLSINLKIDINRKIDSLTLNDLSHKIHNDYSSYDRVFISYTIPSLYKNENQNYAVSSFETDNGYSQDIIGSSPQEDRKMLSDIEVDGKLVDLWKFESLNGDIVLLRVKDSTFLLDRIFKNSQFITDTIEVLGDKTFKVERDGTYTILENGNLELKFDSGTIYTGKRI